jgi:SnoaL-like domain
LQNSWRLARTTYKLPPIKSKEKKMNTEQVAKKVVELVRKQAWYEALDTLYDDDIVSVEAYSAGGGSPETRGKEGVRGKIDWWVKAMEIHSFDASEPFVGHDRFVVQYDADVTDKKSKERRKLSEVGVYTVKNGKIVREEFLPRAD